MDLLTRSILIIWGILLLIMATVLISHMQLMVKSLEIMDKNIEILSEEIKVLKTQYSEGFSEEIKVLKEQYSEGLNEETKVLIAQYSEAPFEPISTDKNNIFNERLKEIALKIQRQFACEEYLRNNHIDPDNMAYSQEVFCQDY